MDENTKQFVLQNRNADVRSLALKKAPANVDLPFALQQIEARQLLEKKVPSWSENDDLLFPIHLSIEQCSSEATAKYKSNLLKGNTFTDLTGGLGIDSYFISQNFSEANYVEMKTELCDLALHNFEVLNANIKVWNESAEDHLEHCQQVDCLYLDPARRDSNGRKTVSIADCTPNVIELQDVLLQKAKKVMVKLSPMLDVTKAIGELRHVSEVHIIAVANECKELVFILERDYCGEPEFHCVNLMTQQPALQFTLDEERECPLQLAQEIGKHLYEPNVALMKGGCFKLLSQRFGTNKLHKNSHLYTSDNLIADFPGRIFEVVGWTPYNKKAKQTLLSDVAKASIAVRNFPLTVAELRKTLKINDGDEVYLFATTLMGDKKVIIRTRKATDTSR